MSAEEVKEEAGYLSQNLMVQYPVQLHGRENSLTFMRTTPDTQERQ